VDALDDCRPPAGARERTGERPAPLTCADHTRVVPLRSHASPPERGCARSPPRCSARQRTTSPGAAVTRGPHATTTCQRAACTWAHYAV
jgi:hypothetical protein